MLPLLSNPALWTLTQGKVLLWLLVLTRLTGLLATFPGLGQERIPLIIRASMAILISMIITPVIPVPSVLPTGMWALIGVMAIELAAGLLMGVLVSWIVDAVIFAGQLMDFQMGFSFVQFIDPATSHTVSISGSILSQLVVLFLFISNLHHDMILALVESFRTLPIGHGLSGSPLVIVAMVGQLLARGLQLALPIMIALFFVDVIEGISAKFMPQLQLIQLAFPLKISVGLVLLGFTIREFPTWIEPLLRSAPREALRLLR
jgi:flagellar biosynthetic protein FliR